MVQFLDGHRVSVGEIIYCIRSRSIARVRVDNDLNKKHFNQIWNRTVSFSKITDEINEDLLIVRDSKTDLLMFQLLQC